MHRLKIADYIIFFLLLAISLSFAFGYSAERDGILISASGKEYYYPLSEERTINVSGPLGETVIEIMDGDARIISSPCPEKTCYYTRLGGQICCLPNRVLITFRGADDEILSY